MYNSPIKTGLMYRELVKEVNKDTDEQIYKAVVACGVDVDRDELLRALAYDRGQYDEGFAAGYRAATPKWIPVEERLPEPFVSVVVHMPMEEPMPTVHEGFLVDEEKWYAAHFDRKKDEITHWMPLPQPPKEVANG